MILSALHEYYQRQAATGNSNIAPPGYEWKEIPFLIVLSTDGIPVAIEDTREGVGNKRRAKRFLVPRGEKKANGIKANLFWENTEYALGIPPEVANEQALRKSTVRHEAFRARVSALESRDEGLLALKLFLDRTSKYSDLASLQHFEELIKDGTNVSFRLAGDAILVSERAVVKQLLDARTASDDQSDSAICLVTGRRETPARLHFSIKGVRGAQVAGANIVSFNWPAFESYGKKQGLNAPVGESVSTAYVTALNNLLERDSRHKIQVGDATTVFWSQKESSFEAAFRDMFDEPPRDDPARGISAVRNLYAAVKSGILSKGSEDSMFYILGLSPNASRISIRFWHAERISVLAQRILQHFSDIEIAHRENDNEVLSLFRLLASTAPQGKADNIPPNLAGETMRSILMGLPYPRTLLAAVVRRIRAEQTKAVTIGQTRAALLKACLNRDVRFHHQNEKEMTMSLDETNTNAGYCLGRLFAVLEKIQSDASPGINATIRDRYYGAASGTPVAVFGSLMRMKNHHLSKLKSDASRVFYERLLAQVFTNVREFPAHLTLADQGRFAIGYYHQNFELYRKKDVPQPTHSAAQEA